MLNKLNLISRSKILQNGIWLFVLQGVNTILPFLTIPYITRILSTEVYGAFSLGLNWVGYLQIVVEYGFELSATRKLAIKKECKTEVNKLYSNVIYTRVFLCIVAAMILFLLEIVMSLSREVKICMVILFLTVIGTVLQHTWFFQGNEDMKYITLANVVSRTISTILIFLLVKSADDIYVYCFLYSLNYILMALLGIIVAKKKYRVEFIKFEFANVLQEIKDGGYIFLSSAMTRIFSGIGITVLGFVTTNEKIGIYSAIYKIPYLLTILWAPVSQVIYPYISKEFNVSWRKGVQFLQKIIVPIFTIYVMLGGGIIALNRPIVYLLFGKEYAKYSVLLIPMILWVLLGILNNFLGVQTLVASGYQKQYSICFTANMIILVSLTVILGRKYTIWGISYAAMFAEFLLFLLLLYEVVKINGKEK